MYFHNNKTRHKSVASGIFTREHLANNIFYMWMSYQDLHIQKTFAKLECLLMKIIGKFARESYSFALNSRVGICGPWTVDLSYFYYG